MLAALWHKLNSRRNAAAPVNRRRTPCLEILEDRCLLSTIAEFVVPTGTSAPFGATMGPDGNVWFTEAQSSQIGTINPTTHAISEFPIPTANSEPLGIAVGPDGNLWFTEAAVNQLAVINPTTHAVTEFALPTAGSEPFSITAGPDGNLWFTELAGNKIGMINPSTHAVAEFPLPTASSSPTGITAGPDGNLWFTENTNSRVATINPISHVITEFATPSPSSNPVGITTGPDGNVWFTESHTNRIVKISPTTHAIIEFPITTAKSGPTSITAGTDGNLWFVEASANKIGSLNPTTGIVTETAIPAPQSSPGGIVTGPGGVLWFTESNTNQVAEVFDPPLVTATPINATVVEGQTATFLAAAAVGLPVPTVQWQVSTDGGPIFTPLVNGGVYSGVTTGTLTITGATMAMSGYKYEAVFSNGVGPSATTAPATLIVNSLLNITPALPHGTPGVNYSQTLSVVGSTTPFTLFSVNNFNAGGTGLTLADITTNTIDGTIVINGTPTGVGIATFTVAVANTAGNTLTKNLTITINPPLSIGTASLPQATAGMPYSQAIVVIGGATPYTTFSVTNFNGGTTGLIPPAITPLAASGTFQITATPLAGGTVSFTVNVTDSAGVTVTKDYTIIVNPPLVITPSLPQGTAGTSYNHTLTVTGGGVPYTTFAVNSFNPGITGLTGGNVVTDAAAGTVTISGTPTSAGTITFTVHVVDAIGAVLNRNYTITIDPALTMTASLPQGTAGAMYHQIIAVAGGTKPYTTFTVSGFSAGATGLTAGAIVVNPTGSIAINGVPTAPGTATFNVIVTDGAGSSLSRAFTITINPAPVVGNLTVTQWTVGKPGFPGVMSISGGTGPHTIASFTGVPSGLVPVLVGNTISFSGTPTTAAFASGSITIHDAVGASATRTFTLTINPAPTIGVLTATQWTLGRPGFTGVMTVAGGTGGLSIVGSTGVPTGLTITLKGTTISFAGTPTVAAPFAGSVTLRDGIGATVTRTFGVTINATPTIGSLSTTQWTAGKSGFTGVMTITAGTGPFTISSASGLPTGLTASVSGNTIRFTGTPTTAQTYGAASITIHDAAGATVARSFSITINPPLQIVTASLPTSKLALLYTTSVHATGGTGVVTYRLTAGSLPPGMRLNSNGTISGASRGFGAFTFTITATDAVGATISKQYTLSLSFR